MSSPEKGYCLVSRSDLGQYTVRVYDSVGGGEGDVSNCKPNFTDVSDMGRCHLGLLWGGQTVADFCLSRHMPLVFAAGA